ncbi:histidine phosphatase family protein [Chloroflexota bacterium]
MTEIILVRHGETAWNFSEVFRGQLDVELNDTGIRQAELLAEYSRHFNLDAVYSSPLKRARQTAEPLAGYHNLAVRVEDGLIDLDFGEWQGLSLKEVSEKYAELYARWVENPQQAIIPGGESLDAVRQRASGVVHDVLSKHGGNIVLVSHRVVNKVLICALLGVDNSHFWNFRQDTCGTTRFTYENGRFILTGHNDTSYLSPLQRVKLNDF